MKLFLLDADYEDTQRGAEAILYCLHQDGKRVEVRHVYSPSFYVLPKGSASAAKKKIEELLSKQKALRALKLEVVDMKLGLEEKKFVRVVCKNQSDVGKVRDVVKRLEGGSVEEEYEYTLNFYRRYLMELGLNGAGWIEVDGKEEDGIIDAKSVKPVDDVKIPQMKVLAFDIESFEEDGKSKIIMISLFGNGYKKVLTHCECDIKFAECLQDEKQMIERFCEIVREQKPDILLSYNGDEFDFNILAERAQEFKVKLNLREGEKVKFSRRGQGSVARIAGLPHIDLYHFISVILGPNLQTETLSLDSIAAELLEDKKIKDNYEKLLEKWRQSQDLKDLAEYCLKDSELTYRLGENTLGQIFALCRLVGQVPYDVSRMTYGQLVEWLLSRKSKEKGIIIPNQPKYDEIKKRTFRRPYEGGYVREPIAGIHEEMAVLDFRSLYPSLIATFNISPETFNCEHCKKTGNKVPDKKYWFCVKEQGLVSSVIKEVILRRVELKKQIAKAAANKSIMENEAFALKIVANATYGIFGFAGARWYGYQCGESAAAYGRHFIKQVIDEAEKEGLTVIYSDTDSVFLKTKDGSSIKKATEKFLDKMNKSLPGIVELNLQGYYKRGIFVPSGSGGAAKKRYALLAESGKLTIRGLEVVRKDWSHIAKDTQEKVIGLVLNENDSKKAVALVGEVVEKLRKHQIPLRELTIHEQLSKPLEAYRQIGPHVIAARKIRERKRPYGQGMIVMYAIVHGSGSISERAEPIEDVKLEDIDEEYYIRNQVVPAALRILQVFGVEEKQLLGETLKKFLKK